MTLVYFDMMLDFAANLSFLFASPNLTLLFFFIRVVTRDDMLFGLRLGD